MRRGSFSRAPRAARGDSERACAAVSSEGRQADRDPEAGQGPEVGPPAADLQQDPAQKRGEDGGQPHHKGQQGEHPRRLGMVEAIAHHRPGHHPAGAAAQGLDEPGGDQELRRGGHGAGAGGDDEQGGAGQDRPLASQPVGSRAVEELADGHARQKGRDRDLGVGRIHLQVRADGRNAGQVHVDGHGRKGRQGAQQDHQSPARARRSRRLSPRSACHARRSPCLPPLPYPRPVWPR